MLLRLPVTVLPRARWIKRSDHRRSALNQRLLLSSCATFRTASRTTDTKSGDDQSPSIQASPIATSPPTTARWKKRWLCTTTVARRVDSRSPNSQLSEPEINSIDPPRRPLRLFRKRFLASDIGSRCMFRVLALGRMREDRRTLQVEFQSFPVYRSDHLRRHHRVSKQCPPQRRRGPGLAIQSQRGIEVAVLPGYCVHMRDQP